MIFITDNYWKAALASSPKWQRLRSTCDLLISNCDTNERLLAICLFSCVLYTYIFTYIHTYVYICMYVHAYICMYIHTYICFALTWRTKVRHVRASKRKHMRTHACECRACIPGCTGVIVEMGHLCQGSGCADLHLFCVMVCCRKYDSYKDINYEEPYCFHALFERMYP